MRRDVGVAYIYPASDVPWFSARALMTNAHTGDLNRDAASIGHVASQVDTSDGLAVSSHHPDSLLQLPGRVMLVGAFLILCRLVASPCQLVIDCARYGSPLFRIAQAIRAILFASATHPTL